MPIQGLKYMSSLWTATLKKWGLGRGVEINLVQPNRPYKVIQVDKMKVTHTASVHSFKVSALVGTCLKLGHCLWTHWSRPLQTNFLPKQHETYAEV